MARIVIDIETDSLKNPTKIPVLVCKDIDTGELNIFRNVTENKQDKTDFTTFSARVDLWVGHHILGFDYPVLSNLLGLTIEDVSKKVRDTFIVSKMVEFSRENGHSIETYGEEFGYPKLAIKGADFFKQWSKDLEDYCVRDVEICHGIFNKYANIISSSQWSDSLELEHGFQLICNDLSYNGFGFNVSTAKRLLDKINKDLNILDVEIQKAFPPREVLIREFSPRPTKFGTISKSSIPVKLRENIHNYELGKTYRYTRFEDFNPSSHKQIAEVLIDAGWRPEDKTEAHKDAERELNQLKYKRNRTEAETARYKTLHDLEPNRKKYGWKINETNLNTLPADAPSPARTLAKRILLESRRRTLTEWLGLVQEDGRIHGEFQGIGAWTHRMSHRKPNTANIPRAENLDGSEKLYGKEFRQLWCAPKKRLLVGVDAEGIQLRIFAHYIDDEEFTDALVKGRKADKTDPHSLNQRIIGHLCKTRAAAKRFIYALLLGAGDSKLSEVLECSTSGAQEAVHSLQERYKGFAQLKEKTIPQDAKRGYFTGIDGRKILIPGETVRDRGHLAMSGYLQAGEAIVVKRAAIITDRTLRTEKDLNQWMFVDIVHDELQAETCNNFNIALKVAKVTADAIREAGEIYKLKCPMAGSYWNDDIGDYTIGTNWYKTH